MIEFRIRPKTKQEPTTLLEKRSDVDQHIRMPKIIYKEHSSTFACRKIEKFELATHMQTNNQNKSSVELNRNIRASNKESGWLNVCHYSVCWDGISLETSRPSPRRWAAKKVYKKPCFDILIERRLIKMSLMNVIKGWPSTLCCWEAVFLSEKGHQHDYDDDIENERAKTLNRQKFKQCTVNWVNKTWEKRGQ